MPKNKKAEESSDSDSGPDDRNTAAPPAKKGKPAAKESSGDEEQKWPISKNRFVKVLEFRGRPMVDIREFYEKNGDILPGKKGICLSVEQWRELVKAVDSVNEALKTK